MTQPEPGTWVAEVGDFLLCLTTPARSASSRPTFDTKGAADTWSNWTEAPTGWAFTNIRTGAAEGVVVRRSDDNDDQTIMLDIVNVDASEVDVAPGFAFPVANAVAGRDPITAGRDNPMRVPIFNNGGAAAGAVAVAVARGFGHRQVVATGTVPLPGYQRGEFEFAYRPAAEGPFDLFVIVDPAGAVAEVVEGNNTQKRRGGPDRPVPLCWSSTTTACSTREDMYTGALRRARRAVRRRRRVTSTPPR